MKRLSHFATRFPVFFSLFITLLFVLFIVLAGIVTYPVEGQIATALVGGGMMLLGAGCWLLLLRGLGWLEPAGFTRLGHPRAWLLLLPLILYFPLIHALAFFQRLDPALPDAALAGALLFENVVDAGLLQEFAFRGLILYALVRVWGQTRRGLFAALSVSALLFSGVHLLNLGAGKPPEITLLQLGDTVLAGFYLGIFVLYTRTIWPAVLFHALGNVVTTILAAGSPDFVETVSAWTLLIALKLPVYLLALYLWGRLPLHRPLPPPEATGPTPGRAAFGQ